MLGIPYFNRKVAIAAAGLLVAGGATAAVVVPRVTASSGGPATSLAASHNAKSTGHVQVHRHQVTRALVRATAKETGLSVATVVQDLRAGQTIDQIAGSKAPAVAGDALSAIQKWLDRAVSRGKITAQQESDLLAKARTRIAALMHANLSKDVQGSANASPASPAATGSGL